MPRAPKLLGIAGLAPQLLAAILVAAGGDEWRFSALALGYAYPALILSFLGGMWWGLAAHEDAPPSWIWVAAVTPSLVALATAIPWAIGARWPGPSLVVLAAALLVTPLVDRALVRRGIAPAWWMRLRVMLSVGLGGLTLIVAAAAPG